MESEYGLDHSSSDTVTINAGASTYPNISGDSGSGFTFAQLTIASGAGLTITAGANNAKTLTVSGVGPGYDVSNAGTITLDRLSRRRRSARLRR